LKRRVKTFRGVLYPVFAARAPDLKGLQRVAQTVDCYAGLIVGCCVSLCVKWWGGGEWRRGKKGAGEEGGGTKLVSDCGATESERSRSKSTTSKTPDAASVTTSHIEMSTLKSCGVCDCRMRLLNACMYVRAAGKNASGHTHTHTHNCVRELTKRA
jgi:hypothetical protein